MRIEKDGHTVDIAAVAGVPFQVVRVPNPEDETKHSDAVTLTLGRPLPDDYDEEDVGRMKVDILYSLHKLTTEIFDQKEKSEENENII